MTLLKLNKHIFLSADIQDETFDFDLPVTPVSSSER